MNLTHDDLNHAQRLQFSAAAKQLEVKVSDLLCAGWTSAQPEKVEKTLRENPAWLIAAQKKRAATYAPAQASSTTAAVKAAMPAGLPQRRQMTATAKIAEILKRELVSAVGRGALPAEAFWGQARQCEARAKTIIATGTEEEIAGLLRLWDNTKH